MRKLFYFIVLVLFLNILGINIISAQSCAGSLLFNNNSDAVTLPLSNQMYSSNGFTWECWFKLNTPFGSKARALIINEDPVVYEDIFLGFGWNYGTGNFPINHLGFKVDGPNSTTGPTNVSCNYMPPGGFILGTWYHAAGVMDYNTQTAKLYVNGLLVDTKTVVSDPFSRTILGQLSYSPNLGLGGNLDEVRIWKKVRTASEILADYDKCLIGNEADLFSYYRCNQSTGSVVIDASPNGNNGTFVNSTSWSVQQPAITGSACTGSFSIMTTSNCNNSTAIVTLSTSVVSPVVSYTWTNSNGVSVSQTNNSSSLADSVPNLANGVYTVNVNMNTPCGVVASSQTLNVNCSVSSTVSSLCSGTLGAPVFFEDFGSGTSLYGPALPAGVTNYIYQTGPPPNGTYVISSSSNPSGINLGYVADGDHTGNLNGYMMVINSDYPASEVYRKHVTGLCQNTTYVFSSYLSNNNTPSTPGNVCPGYVYANVKLYIEYPLGTVQNSVTTGNLPLGLSNTALNWNQYGFAFTTLPGQTSVDIVLKNNAPGGCGNDYVVDDISLSPCGPGVALSIVPNQTVFCVGDAISLQSNFTSGGYSNPQYQWQNSTDGGITWTNITGATSANYSISSVSSSQAGMYQLIISENGNINLPSCRIAAGPLSFIVNCNNGPIASFTAPDTVCVNQLFSIINTSTLASSNYWSFCQGNTNLTPIATNLGNIGSFNGPVFSTIAKDGPDYYVFITNNTSSTLSRLYYGNSLLNTPVATNLGNVSSVFPSSLEDLHLEYDGINWYGIAVGGFGGTEAIVRLTFGTSLANAPTAVSMGNIGGMNYPQRLKIFKSGGNYYGFTTNRNNNTITRFDFGASLANTPVGLNLGNIGSLNTPDAIALINVSNTWYGYVINEGSNTITRLDFGNSLLNTPTGSNLGNTGVLNGPRGLDMWTECNEVRGLITNRFSNDLLNMNLPTGPTGAVITTSFGNLAGFSFPHSITRFRSGDTLFAFITNVSNNTLSRIYYPGCTNASVPSSTLTNPPSISYNASGTYYINLVIDEGLITQTNYCKQIIVIGSPTITVSNASLCEGSAATLTAGGANSYSWTGSPLSAVTGSLVTCSPMTNTTYTVTGSISSCTSSAVSSVTVIPNPVITITPTLSSVCPGQTATLSANGANTYIWSPAITLSTGTGSVVVANPTSMTIYTVIGTLNTCTNSAIATVSVLAAPSITLSSNTNICLGTNSSATLTVSGASSYSWTNSSSLSSSTGSMVIASPNATTDYTVTGVSNTCSNTAVVTVSVNPSPTITATFINNTSCGLSNGSATITASSANTYSWSSGVSSATNSANALSAGNYTVIAANGTCQTSTVVAILSSTALQITSSTITQADCILNNGGISVMDNGINSNYAWSPGISSTSGSINNLSSGIYSLTISNGACTTSSVFVVPMLNGPTLLNVNQSNVVCKSDIGSINITNVVNGLPPYTFDFNNSGFSSVISYSNLTQGIYTITVKDANSCTFTQTFTIGLTQFTATINEIIKSPNCDSNDGEVIIQDISGGAAPYLISFNDTSFKTDTIFAPLSAGNYSVNILDANKCLTGFLIVVPENDEDYTLYIPNTFTPNTDIINDLWYVQGTCLGDFSCQIYNRWGEKIIELNDIKNGWDGTYKGTQVPDGVYAYLIEVQTKKGTINKAGHITLFR